MVKRVVLVVGSGGREHAIAYRMACSPQVDEVLVAPGNGGTATAGGKIRNVELSSDNIPILVAFAKEQGVSLVVVGPEQPLVDGLSDAMNAASIPCFGPSAKAAQIEASKAWSKDFMARNMIRTARYKNFTDFNEAKKHLESIDYRVVVKASGLAAGKGVIIPTTQEESIEAAKSIMLDQSFGNAGAEIVVEEFLEGEEISLLAFCDGVTAVGMPGAQDHKRIFDGDQGPNTGGMGAYAPAPLLTTSLRHQCMGIVQATVAAMAAEGCPYQGVLYAGFMITKEGPVVLEYNCRFGDPETQVLMPLLSSDLYDIMLSCVRGTLNEGLVKWSPEAACTVVMAAPGYPGSCPKGAVITGLEAAGAVSGVTVFHAGTKLAAASSSSSGQNVVTNGGRVLAVTGRGVTINAAVANAYKAVTMIDFVGRQYRTDIASRGMSAPLRLGVLGSTRGTDMQAVIDAIEKGTLNAKITVVVSNKADSGILDRASRHGIISKHIPVQGRSREAYDDEVNRTLEQHGVQLVLMIGYMRIVSAAFTDKWLDRCMNAHPSLLPDFAGGMDLQVHEAVLAAGKTKSGCTVHFVTEQVDGGPIVVQSECAVVAGETAESLKAKVQDLEGAAFVQAVAMFRSGAAGPYSAIASGPVSRKRGAEVLTYRSAGVDIDAGEALVEAIKPYCKATRRAGCDADLGGFGGLFDMAQAGYDKGDTVLVSGTDGVGTKLKIAQAVGKHDTIGIDLVAMCVNDILVCGAEPLFFLDYYATGALQVSEAAQVVKGIAEGCRQCGAALIGGETAEMAGMYAKGEYDLAGFSVGAVRRSEILPLGIGAGDVLIGLRSSGVHSNGYSLVRKCVEKSGLTWEDPAPFQPGTPLGAALLEPTRIYVAALLPLIKQGLLKGMAHITGGGLLDNLPRVLTDDIAAVVDPVAGGWTLPPVFQWLQTLANLPQHELLRTFNCGVGMVLVVDATKADAVMAALLAGGEDRPMRLGVLTARAAGSAQVVMTGDVL